MIKIINFYADWCGPCQAMKPVFEELHKEYEGKVIFEKVDVEQDSEKSGKYGVLSIPTFVIEKEGKEVDRKTGAMPKESLKAWLDSNL